MIFVKKATGVMSGLAISLFLLMNTAMSLAGELQEFKPGEVISSDMFNENFELLEETASGFENEKKLLGTWRCDCIMGADYHGSLPLSSDGLYRDGGEEIFTFSYTGGQYWVGSQNYMLFTSQNQTPPMSHNYNSLYKVIANIMLFDSPNGYTNYLRIHRKSRYYMVMTRNYGYIIDIWDCQRVDRPPEKPTDLNASETQPRDIALGWTDKSGDESGFKIYRRDTLTGPYNLIDTVSSDVTVYQDVVTAKGTYWYRVKATNAHGDSLGSNVAVVDVTQ